MPGFSRRGDSPAAVVLYGDFEREHAGRANNAPANSTSGAQPGTILVSGLSDRENLDAERLAKGGADRWEDAARRQAPNFVDTQWVDPHQVRDMLDSDPDMGDAEHFNWQDVNANSGAATKGQSGLGSMLRLLNDWDNGAGASHRVFGPGSVEAAQMQQSVQGQDLRDAWYKKFKDVESEEALGDLTDYGAKFRPSDIPRAGLNAMSQFVGSARGEARYNKGEGTVTFMLHNPTSVKSLLYGQGPAWERSTFKPGGNMRQAYVWKEKIDKSKLGLE